MEKNFKKTDVVDKYHAYKKIWDRFPLCSGKDNGAQIRADVQEKLAYQPPLPPNAPVKKKRKLPPTPTAAEGQSNLKTSSSA